MIQILGFRDLRVENRDSVINTTSSSKTWSRGLSPFFVGPVELPDGRISQNVENAWQYSKVYSKLGHFRNGLVTQEWIDWSTNGFQKQLAERYPAGKGAIPEFSVYANKTLGYIESRILLYAPLYSNAVQKTTAFSKLKEIYESTGSVALVDYDGYLFNNENASWLDILLDPKRKMGHAFVLGMMLDGKLEQTLDEAKALKNLAEFVNLDKTIQVSKVSRKRGMLQL